MNREDTPGGSRWAPASKYGGRRTARAPTQCAPTRLGRLGSVLSGIWLQSTKGMVREGATHGRAHPGDLCTRELCSLSLGHKLPAPGQETVSNSLQNQSIDMDVAIKPARELPILPDVESLVLKTAVILQSKYSEG